MLHRVDSANPIGPAPAPLDRGAWMAVLSRTPLSLLEPALAAHTADAPHWLRAPETGLMMVEARAGGTGDRFNLGEVTLTRCALRLPEAPGVVGVAYVLGRSHRQARLAATADALLQDPAHRSELQALLLGPAQRHIARAAADRRGRVRGSKVEFFTVAREAGAGEADEDDA